MKNVTERTPERYTPTGSESAIVALAEMHREVLAALKALLRAADNSGCCSTACQNAREVIAKAEGRT